MVDDVVTVLPTVCHVYPPSSDINPAIPPESQLVPVPGDGLPERTAAALNENVERLNALLYGPLEYALLARR